MPARPLEPCRRRAPAAAHAHGAATLTVVGLLLAAMTLAVLYSHRALLVEQQGLAQQVRAALALQAAEAGRDWALALLQHPGSLDAHCQDAGGASGTRRFAQRYAGAGQSLPVASPGCVHAGTDLWRCSCPASGSAALSAPDPATQPGEHPAYLATLLAGPAPGLLRLRVSGCSAVAQGCGGSQPPDASAQVEQLLAALGRLQRLPDAALVSAGTASLGAGVQLVNDDPASGGWTVQAGAAVQLDALARLWPPAGRPPAASVLSQQSALAGDTASLWRRWLGLGREQLRTLPALHRLDCRAGCGSADVAAVLQTGRRALWLDGDLTLADEVDWGSADDPVLLLVDGALVWRAPGRLHGLALAAAVDWQPGTVAADARVQGALVSLGDARLSGALAVVRDAAVLAQVQDLGATWLPVPGSWRDFDTP